MTLLFTFVSRGLAHCCPSKSKATGLRVKARNDEKYNNDKNTIFSVKTSRWKYRHAALDAASSVFSPTAKSMSSKLATAKPD